MKQTIQISAFPLLKSEAVIIERGLVVIERISIRSKFGDVQRCEIKELPELPFALSDFFFRPLCLGDIHRGADKFYEVTRLVQDRMAYNMKMLDSSVGKNNTLVHFVLGLLIFAFFSTFQNPLPILGMKPAIPKFSIRRILIRAAAE